MARPETVLTSSTKFLDGLPLADDAYASAKAGVVRALAAQVDDAKGSNNPSVVRSVPTIARQLSVEISELQEHFARPELTPRDRLMDFLNLRHQTDELVARLGLDEIERRWLSTEHAEPGERGDWWHDQPGAGWSDD